MNTRTILWDFEAEGKLLVPLKRRVPSTYKPKGDLFHENVKDEWLDKVFAVMALSPQHTFQILTKRPERMRAYLQWEDTQAMRVEAEAASIITGTPASKLGNIQHDGFKQLSNVWLGVSVEDQKTADERIPLLLQTPAAVRFLSVEPMLGSVDLKFGYLGKPGSVYSRRNDLSGGLDWVIVGGESGPGARSCDLAWIRSVVEQCNAAGVPVFVKQDSGPRPGMQGRIPDDLWIKEFPNAQ